jgi:integrase
MSNPIFSKRTLIKILERWSTPQKIQEIKEDFKPFYSEIGYSYKNGTKTITDFLINGTEAGLVEWTTAEFKKYTPMVELMARGTISNINTLIKVFNLYRANVIRYNNISSEEYKFLENTMSMTKEEAHSLKKVSELRVVNKNESLVNIYTNNVQRLADLVRNSKRFEDRIILMQLASGSRFIEILSKDVSEFEVVENKPNWIKQIGVAKSKEVQKTIEKPLLYISGNQFMRKIAKIRVSVETATNDTLSSKYNNRVNARLRELSTIAGINPSKETNTTHGLRRIYINLAHLKSGGQSSLQAFIGRYLAHDTISTASANYSSIKVIKGSNPNPPDIPGPPVDDFTEIAQAAAQLTEEGKSLTYKNLREKGFKDLLIKKYKLTLV